jgi:hypothetical protein
MCCLSLWDGLFRETHPNPTSEANNLHNDRRKNLQYYSSNEFAVCNGACQKAPLHCDSVKTQWEVPILSIKQLLINGRQYEVLRMQWNRFRFCHIHYCLAEIPHYMTLVIAENTLQELSRMGKTQQKIRANYTCVPKSGTECDANSCYTAFNFHYGICSSEERG